MGLLKTFWFDKGILKFAFPFYYNMFIFLEISISTKKLFYCRKNGIVNFSHLFEHKFI